MEKILFVEDDDAYRELLTNILTETGYLVESVSNALDAIQKCALQEYNLIISDLMLEAIDGIKFLAHIKKDMPNVKTMILTAEPSMDTELESLNIHVDKYLTKETRVDVLLKHIETLMQSKETKKRKILVAKDDDVIMDVAGRKVKKNNQEIPLTPKEFSVLKILLENLGTAVSREEFLKTLWDADYEIIDTRTIDVHIKSIRRKLAVQKIVSIRGMGYKWDN
jgi:Response regulators consisting of a CheY-like receiver domain and a winged-helix DNA-binding domain